MTRLPSEIAHTREEADPASPAWARFIPGLLIAVVLSEFLVLLLKAAKRRFWYDEILTLQVSSLEPFAAVLKALRAGADGMTPGYYMIVRLGRMLPGDAHVTLRLTSILGYALALLGVYWFARRRLPAMAALTAVLLLALTPFRTASGDARAYSLPAGLFALAAVCWQRIGRKPLMTAAFGLLLILAVSEQYMNIEMLLVFGAAEIAWIVVEKRVRWGVWAAFALSVVTFVLQLPVLLGFRAAVGTHFWSSASWVNVVTTYSEYLGFDYKLAFPLALLFGLVIGDLLYRRLRRPAEAAATDVPDLVLLGGLILYPAILAILTRLLHSGFTPRYAWPAVLGMVLAPGYLAAGLWRKPYAAYVPLALLAAFALQTVNDLREVRNAPSSMVTDTWMRIAELSRGEPDLPIVVASPLAFVDALEEAPPELRGRLVEVIDPELANRLVGTDTTEIENRVMARFIPLHVIDLSQFQNTQQKFLLNSGSFWDWLTPYLVRQGYRLRLLGAFAGQSLYLVER